MDFSLKNENVLSEIFPEENPLRATAFNASACHVHERMQMMCTSACTCRKAKVRKARTGREEVLSGVAAAGVNLGECTPFQKQ